MEEDETIVPGPSRAGYYLVQCPKLGKRRSSILCETTCHNTGFSTNKMREERAKCPAFKALADHKAKNPLPTWDYLDEDDDDY